MKKIPIERPSNNYTKYPNCILDNLDQFSGNELLVLSLVVRKNLGWEDPNFQFSSGYVSKKTGLSIRTVVSCLDKLEKKGSIKCIGVEFRGVKLYDINWVSPTYAKSAYVDTYAKSAQVPMQILHTVLDNKVKETNKHIDSRESNAEIEQNINEANYRLLNSLKHNLSDKTKEKIKILEQVEKIYEKIITATGVDLTGAKNETKYLYGALKQDGLEGLIMAIEGYLASEWHRNEYRSGRVKWNWLKFFSQKGERARYLSEEKKRKSMVNNIENDPNRSLNKYHTEAEMQENCQWTPEQREFAASLIN